jgi:hypothetical protein
MALPRIESITNRCIQQGCGLSNDVQEAVWSSPSAPRPPPIARSDRQQELGAVFKGACDTRTAPQSVLADFEGCG